MLKIPLVAFEAIYGILNVEKGYSIKVGVAKRASETGGMERGVQGSEDPVNNRLLAVLALRLRGLPTYPVKSISELFPLTVFQSQTCTCGRAGW